MRDPAECKQIPVVDVAPLVNRDADCQPVTTAIGRAFRQNGFLYITGHPTVLFRVFHYPPLVESQDDELWSVGEHTDYGLLTLLMQDETGGLQIKSQGEWIDALPVSGSLICNIGDMLDKMTGGLYRSTPHRVRNPSGRSRYSFPFFFDPGWDAEVKPILPSFNEESRSERWDGENLDTLTGTYGEYLMKKVSKVFPDLSQKTK